MNLDELFEPLMESTRKVIGRKNGQRVECWRIIDGINEGKLINGPLEGLRGVRKQFKIQGGKHE